MVQRPLFYHGFFFFRGVNRCYRLKYLMYHFRKLSNFRMSISCPIVHGDPHIYTAHRQQLWGWDRKEAHNGRDFNRSGRVPEFDELDADHELFGSIHEWNRRMPTGIVFVSPACPHSTLPCNLASTPAGWALQSPHTHASTLILLVVSIRY